MLWCLWASASTKASRLFKFRYLHPAYLGLSIPALTFWKEMVIQSVLSIPKSMWLPAPLSSDGMNCWSWSAVHSEQSQGWANRHQSCLGESQSSILFSVWERANPPSCTSNPASPSALPILEPGTSNPLLVPPEPGQSLFPLP